MPFLIRLVAQRLIILGLSGLAFFGINPEINIPTTEEAQTRAEERREIVKQTVSKIRDEDKEIPARLDARQAKDGDDNRETKEEIVFSIPIPKSNIFDEFKKNITRSDAIKTQPPVVPSVPTKTTIPYTPPQTQETQTPIIDSPKIDLPESEVITAPPQKAPDTSETNSIANAVVNIVCVRRNGNKTHLSTGSGVIISPKGIVLTNTHVAQHFLLESIGYKCSLRRENIPLYGFEAEPIYISEKWVEDNFLLISNPSPTGTGEDDYALLRITKSTNPAISLPSSFAYIEPNTESEIADIGNQVTVAGYPGGTSGVFDLDSNVSLETDQTSIKNVFTFNKTSIDVFSTGDTTVAQRGSSGGGIFKNGKLIGLIVTTSPGSHPSKQVLNALTLDYINKDLREETGKSLSGYLSSDLADLAQNFRSSVAQHLTELLLRNL